MRRLVEDGSGWAKRCIFLGFFSDAFRRLISEALVKVSSQTDSCILDHIFLNDHKMWISESIIPFPPPSLFLFYSPLASFLPYLFPLPFLLYLYSSLSLFPHIPFFFLSLPLPPCHFLFQSYMLFVLSAARIGWHRLIMSS